MAKVQISEAQAEFIETFGRRKYKALHYISRVGWDYEILDGNDKPHNKEGKEWINLFYPESFIDVKELLIRAVLDGYEIIKPPLYTVEIPNPKRISEDAHVLMKNGFNNVVIVYRVGDDWKNKKGFQLTEEEIKQDFEWAWQWAKPVEEQ